MTDVVITGFGATTPLGADAPSTWQGLVEGRNGVHTLDHEWAEGLPVTSDCSTPCLLYTSDAADDAAIV